MTKLPYPRPLAKFDIVVGTVMLFFVLVAYWLMLDLMFAPDLIVLNLRITQFFAFIALPFAGIIALGTMEKGIKTVYPK